ncbi:DUF1128 domain-containing protein [Oceanobacillus alkalisoli]|uniref:DUF1128 domain-containing protein n=1 Tax=Oceanobacillus alkalisoli TaxID=2925113 RepID=UPI001EEFCB08|nr:DUF1128 domain-containing protein [Oceanobacillus alkalisoli]MCF3942463.1 DUF1128 domain-containing protein [Oceanobacillus alkalisoli]MCG5103520.1 DUF1128 domain-containing protein [Oceanobacillus alkalisoli]
MSFDEANQENLSQMLNELADHLNVANRGLFDAEDYDLNKYNDLKLLHQVIMNKEKLSALETQAFVDELATIRKK